MTTLNSSSHLENHWSSSGQLPCCLASNHKCFKFGCWKLSSCLSLLNSLGFRFLDSFAATPFRRIATKVVFAGFDSNFDSFILRRLSHWYASRFQRNQCSICLNYICWGMACQLCWYLPTHLFKVPHFGLEDHCYRVHLVLSCCLNCFNWVALWGISYFLYPDCLDH